MSNSVVDRASSDETEEEKEQELLEEAPLPQSTLLTLLHHKHIITADDVEVSEAEKNESKAATMQLIQRHKMAPYLKSLNSTLPAYFPMDEKLAESLTKQNCADIEELQNGIKCAEQGLGEVEVRDAIWKLALYYIEIGDKHNAIEQCEATFKQTMGTASKIDVVFALIRLGLAFQDAQLTETQLKRARSLVEQGGDWERKNLLSVYEATLFITQRNFQQASKLLISSISTFTATELYPYTQFVFYTVLLALCTVSRAQLNTLILQQSEILSVIDEIPHLRQYVTSLYNTDYGEFFESLSHIITHIKHDEYLTPHLAHYVSEIRIHTYSQYLQPFRQAQIQSMAQTFQISQEMCETELYKFVSAGRLAAKIDGVNRVIISQRPDLKAQQYEDMIKAGDSLLNRIQKLNKLIAY